MVVVVVVILEQTRRNAWENRANLRYCFVQNSLQFLGADVRLLPNFSRRPRAYYHQRRHHIGFRSDRVAVSSQIDNNRYAYFAISERLFEAHLLGGRRNAR
jgi:hypothetical protein